jgi:hypothetical protein
MGGTVRWDLGLLLEYVEPARAEVHGGDATCLLFIPCSVRVWLSSPPRGAAEPGVLHVSFPETDLIARGAGKITSSPSIEVTALTMH